MYLGNAMKKQIWVGGFPSLVGGADTELLHNIDLWRKKRVDVNLVPMFGYDENMKNYVQSLGCNVHEYNKNIFSNKIVVSYCNGNFLEKLPEIIECGRPKKIIWFNCMTWPFDKELEIHKNGWIDYFGFISKYQEQLLKPILEKINPVHCFQDYRPYFNPNNKHQAIKFEYRKPIDYFGAGRISRADPSKFSTDMWNIFYKINTPQNKKVFILGYDTQTQMKTGAPPDGLDWMYWSPGAISIKEIHDRIHCLIHKTGGSRESYCRIVPECYAFGTPVIAENNYAFPDLIVDNETGFLCDNSDEMSYRASELAFNENKRKNIIYQAYDHLINNIASIERCWNPWKQMLD
jgi:hypothetical protein